MKCDMKYAESTVMEQDAPHKTDSMIRLPSGLLGFEAVKQYVLLGRPEEAPFLWFKMLQEPKLSFLVVEPSAVVEKYAPDISDLDIEQLGIRSPEEGLILNIVTMHRDGRATVNLKGPILINRRTLEGKQVALLNARAYALQHPINAITT
jgi:flagellar assembly factor FliW